MLSATIANLASAPLAPPIVALFIGEGRAAALQGRFPILDAIEVRRGAVARLPDLDRPSAGGLLVIEVPSSMQANSIAALARDFTLNGVGVVLVAPGGCNGLHSALGITDERLSLDGEADLAPMIIAVADEASLLRALDRLRMPNATLELVRAGGIQ